MTNLFVKKDTLIIVTKRAAEHASGLNFPDDPGQELLDHCGLANFQSNIPANHKGIMHCYEADEEGIYWQRYEEIPYDPNNDKLNGIEFDGVMCSATAEDQHGLADIKDYVKAGTNINFHFENGNKLLLTSSNWDAFEAVWFPFRLSFFPVGE